MSEKDKEHPGFVLMSASELGLSQRTLTCKFTCDLCGLKDVEVEVPVRPVALDVVTWTKSIVTPRMVEAHSKRSPLCKPKTLTAVKIPISDADGNEATHIGGLPQKPDSKTTVVRFRNKPDKKEGES